MSKMKIGVDADVLTLKKILDANAARQKLAVKNLANAATEGYEPKKIEFVEELGKALGKVQLKTKHPQHLASRRAQATSRGYAEAVDEEALDDPATRLEKTVADLADAEMVYSTAAKLIQKRTATLRTAISGR